MPLFVTRMVPDRVLELSLQTIIPGSVGTKNSYVCSLLAFRQWKSIEGQLKGIKGLHLNVFLDFSFKLY